MNLCCCGTNKSYSCVRKISTNHCYKKCLIYKRKKIKSTNSEANSNSDNINIMIVDDGACSNINEDIKEHDSDDEAKFFDLITQIHSCITGDIHIPISPITPIETLSLSITTESPLKKQKK